MPRLIHGSRLDQGKFRDLDRKRLSVVCFHIVVAGHRPEFGRQRTIAGVLKTLARSQGRMLADHPRTINLLGSTHRISNSPMTLGQGRRLPGHVGDRNPIGIQPGAGIWYRSLGNKQGLDINPVAVSFGSSRMAPGQRWRLFGRHPVILDQAPDNGNSPARCFT